jgi:23S rRNA pseudouridine2604 synthase
MACGLQVTSERRIRLGRIALAGLAPGEWRFLRSEEWF